ncbi:hypothetical protein ACQJBY_032440 [Aegilops geniculata]
MEVLSEQQLVGCDYEVVRGYRRMRMLGSSHCSTDLKLSTRDTCTVTTFIVTTTTGCGAEAGNLSSIGSSLVTKRRFPGRYKHLQLEDISNNLILGGERSYKDENGTPYYSDEECQLFSEAKMLNCKWNP